MKEQCLRFYFKNQEEIQKKIFGDKRKRIFCLEKRFFRKSKIDRGQKKKKTEPKGEEKLKGVSQRDEKRERKRRLKRNTKILQKKRETKLVFFFEKNAKQEKE